MFSSFSVINSQMIHIPGDQQLFRSKKVLRFWTYFHKCNAWEYLWLHIPVQFKFGKFCRNVVKQATALYTYPFSVTENTITKVRRIFYVLK
jgi:hypothetical protein